MVTGNNIIILIKIPTKLQLKPKLKQITDYNDKPQKQPNHILI